MELAERIFCCDGCGLALDRDRNAAVNLAAWAEHFHAQVPDRQAGGRVWNSEVSRVTCGPSWVPRSMAHSSPATGWSGSPPG